MSEKSVGSLTQGPILPVLTRLAVPIMAASFLSTAYSITDMAWVGMLGSKAVAGIGVGGMYAWLSNGLSTLARMGGQVHVGQALGRGEVEEARQYTAAALQLTTLFGILFGAVCLLLRGESREEVEAFLARDPYQLHKLNRFILKEYFPTERSELVKDW